MSVYSTTWSYNKTEFSESSGTFNINNYTGTYTVTAVVVFHGLPATPQASNSSSLFANETIVVVPIYLGTPTLGPMINVTSTSTKQLLRNPDGSFYKNDSFCTQWTETFTLYQVRPDISVSVSIAPNETRDITILNSTATSNTAGTTCYSIASSAQYMPYNLSLSFNTISPSGLKTAHIYYTATPFTVVQYDPLFKYFIYMEYNSRAPTSYARPFAIIISYEGNNPGFGANYTGNINTAPITAYNDTNERAWINNFTTSVVGYNTTYTYYGGLVNVTQMIPFKPISNTNVTIIITNSTKPAQTQEMFFSSNNLYKYYFHVSNMTTIYNDVYNENILYYQVEVNAWSDNYAGGNYSVFSTPYVYQPLFLNGNVTFNSIGALGKPDPNTNITLTLVNPTPLNMFLIHEFNATMGENNPTAYNEFKADLSNDAYNSTVVLTPYINNPEAGTWTWLINQTNIAYAGSTKEPYLIVNASEINSGFITAQKIYNVPLAFSNYLLNSTSLFPSSPHGSIPTPFNSTMVYSLDQQKGLVASPLNFTERGAGYYLWYEPPYTDIVLPPTPFPGNFSNYYSYLFGNSTTVIANWASANGYITFHVTNNSAVSYQASLYIGPKSAGLVDVWIGQTTNLKDCPQADLVSVGNIKACQVEVNYIPPDTQSPLVPPGFIGATQFSYVVGVGQSYVVGYDTTWGVHGILWSFTVSGTPSGAPWSSPSQVTTFLTVLGVIVVALFILSRQFHYSPLQVGKESQQ